MPRDRGLARACTFLGLLAAMAAWMSLTLSRTVLDPEFSAATARDMLASDPVQRQLGMSLAGDIAKTLPPGTSPVVARLAAEDVLSNDDFARAFTQALSGAQQQALGAGNGEVSIDQQAVARSVRNALVALDPSLATRLPEAQVSEPMRLKVGDASLPVAQWGRTLRPWAAPLALFALVLLTFGVVLDPTPESALRRTGRKIMGLALPGLTLLLVGPWVAQRLGGDLGGLAAPLLGASRARIALPAALLVLAGAALWIAGRLLTAPTPTPVPAAPVTNPRGTRSATARVPFDARA